MSPCAPDDGYRRDREPHALGGMAPQGREVLARRAKDFGEASDELSGRTPAALLDLGNVRDVVTQGFSQMLLRPSVVVAPLPDPMTEPVHVFGNHCSRPQTRRLSDFVPSHEVSQAVAWQK